MVSVLGQAVRSWRSAKGIALLAILAFAAGIGSATAIYSVVNTVMLAPLPYPNGDRFVALYGARFSEPNQYAASTFVDLQEYERRTTSFDVFGWFRLGALNLTAPGEPRHLNVVSVTPSLAHNLGVNPAIGRWFTDDTGAVISNALWRQLGADANLVGQGITLADRRLTVTGVMPAGFRLPFSGIGTEGFRTDVWIYLDPLGKGQPADQGLFFAYARRKPGVALAQAEAEVKQIAAQIAKLAPASHRSYTARLDDLRETSISAIRPTLLLLFAAAGLLVLITCANVGGLLLARSVARARETATRVALGASQRQLALQYLVEALLVSLAGAAAGAVVSVVLVRSVVTMAVEYIPRADEIAVDWKVLAFGLATACVAGAISSLAPLWQATRIAPGEVLSAGVRASAGARVRRLSQALVIAEIALAFTLLAVSAVLIAHLQGLIRIAPGFDPNQLITFDLTMPDSIAEHDETREPYQKRLIEAMEAVPGVSAVAFVNQLPLDGCCLGGTIYPEGRAVNPDAVERTSFVIATPGFIGAMKIPLRGGRLLNERDDRSDTLLHVLINQAAAARYWPGQNPIDAYGHLNAPDGPRFRVVGVVGDVRANGLGKSAESEVYLLHAITTVNPMTFVVRSPLPADALLPAIRRAVQRVDPGMPIHGVISMNEIIQGSLVLERVSSVVMTFFALAALLMATLGVYGIVAYGVRQRTVEIGTRMALGAVNRDVVRLVLGGGLRMAAWGIALGSVAVVAAAGLLARFFDARDVGMLPFAIATAVIAGVAALASSVPAWRASRLSPMVAIRDQSQSMWHSARRSIQRAAREMSRAFAREDERFTLSESALLTEFVDAARRADSFSEAIRIALATLCSRLQAGSAVLLEKVGEKDYRPITATFELASDVALPADGFLLNRLKAHTFPLTLGELDPLLQWAREHKPERVAEIETLKHLDVRLAVALRTKNEILGVLLLGPPSGREEYGAAEKQVLPSCAHQFALLIENARLTNRVVEQEKLRRDLALAAEVQKRLLPDRPPEPGLAELAAVSLPARIVGGDYYDFIDVGDHRLGIALADVAGKGIAAALIMSVVQASLRIISSEGDVTLPQLVAKMNRFLYRSTASTSYATFFYAQIDEEKRQLRYVNAGHNPPYHIRPVRGIDELTTGGAVIGLFPEMSYEEGTVDLHCGDVVVAFTDGVIEALNASEEEFGEDRLKELLRGVVHLPVRDIAAAISAELKNWIKDAAQYDDLTFVVMKVN